MRTQRNLALVHPRRANQPQWSHALENQQLKNPSFPVPADKLFADLLKRQAVRVMADITECPPDTLPAHVSRLVDLVDIIKHAFAYEHVPGAETRPSGQQLQHPATLADFLECLMLTKKTHRAPAWVNGRDRDIAMIRDSIEKLCGLVANNAGLVEHLTGPEMEEEL